MKAKKKLTRKQKEKKTPDAASSKYADKVKARRELARKNGLPLTITYPEMEDEDEGGQDAAE